MVCPGVAGASGAVLPHRGRAAVAVQEECSGAGEAAQPPRVCPGTAGDGAGDRQL